MRVLRIVALLIFIAVAANFATAQDAPPPKPEHDGTLRRLRVPILMYHYISDLPADADEFRVELTVEPNVFRAHMQHLTQAGYNPISLYDVDNALRTGDPLPPRPVVLTFDDGHLDHYTQAFPILEEYGFPGTFFVITSLLDTNHPNYISWPQAQEMALAGHSIEPHTKNHMDLRQRDRDFLVYQMLGSIESIEANLGSRPSMFSYPGGRYDEQTLQVARDAAIQRAVTTAIGSTHTTSNRLEVSRVRVAGNLSVAGLEYLLTNF